MRLFARGLYAQDERDDGMGPQRDRRPSDRQRRGQFGSGINTQQPEIEPVPRIPHHRHVPPTRQHEHGDVDVAMAGGWSDLTSLKTAYQQADAETLYRVVSEPTELREAQ